MIHSGESTPRDAPAGRPRKGWAAALLTFVMPGLGHLYAGRPARGLALLAAFSLAAWGLIALAMTAPHGALRLAAAAAVLAAFALLVRDAVRTARGAPRPYAPRPYNRWWVYLLLAIVLRLGVGTVNQGLIRAHVARAYSIPGPTMAPALLPGDYLLASPRVRTPARGTVVVARRDRGLVVVSRVAGVPGDTLQMRGGRLYVNGRAQAEPYAVPQRAPGPEWPGMAWQRAHLAPGADTSGYRPTATEWGPLVVPPERYFVMGDNRPQSLDSRHLGFVEADSLAGRPVWIYFSRDPDSGALRWSRMGRTIR